MTKMFKTNDGKVIEIMNDHLTYKSGSMKTVCVSSVLSYLGITPDMYTYTSSVKNLRSYEGVLRRFGYNVRSRKSAFKSAKTIGQLRKEIRKYEDYTPNVKYMVMVYGHLMLLDAQGNTVVDTASRKVDKRRIIEVKAVFK